MSLSSALHTLANYRAHNTRASRDVVEKGTALLEAGSLRKLGDDGTIGANKLDIHSFVLQNGSSSNNYPLLR